MTHAIGALFSELLLSQVVKVMVIQGKLSQNQEYSREGQEDHRSLLRMQNNYQPSVIFLLVLFMSCVYSNGKISWLLLFTTVSLTMSTAYFIHLAIIAENRQILSELRKDRLNAIGYTVYVINLALMFYFVIFVSFTLQKSDYPFSLALYCLPGMAVLMQVFSPDHEVKITGWKILFLPVLFILVYMTSVFSIHVFGNWIGIDRNHQLPDNAYWLTYSEVKENFLVLLCIVILTQGFLALNLEEGPTEN